MFIIRASQLYSDQGFDWEKWRKRPKLANPDIERSRLKKKIISSNIDENYFFLKNNEDIYFHQFDISKFVLTYAFLWRIRLAGKFLYL